MAPPDASRRWTPLFLGDDVPPPAGPYTPVVRAGDFLFVSGQVPRDRSGALVGATIEEQARQTLSNVRDALAAAGATLEDVVAVTVYLADENDWGRFNEVYKTFFSPPFPSRTAIGAGLRGILVEVTVTAWLGGTRQAAR